MATSREPDGGVKPAVVAVLAALVLTTAGELASSASVPDARISAAAQLMVPAPWPVGVLPPTVTGVDAVVLLVARPVARPPPLVASLMLWENVVEALAPGAVEDPGRLPRRKGSFRWRAG